MPKISVQIIAYNVERFIEEAVRSVMAQNFEDFELIVVEDGSKDKTWEILKQLEHKLNDPRFKLFTNIVNKGVRASRQRTLVESKGEYVAILDSDDVSLPNRLQSQVDYLEAHSDVVAVASLAEVIDESGKILRNSAWIANAEHIYYNLHFRNCLTHSSMMYRRAILEEVGGFNLEFAEDYDVYSKLMCLGRIEILPEYLIQYRQSGNQATNIHKPELWKNAFKISQTAIEKVLNKKVKYELICGLMDLDYFAEMNSVDQEKTLNLLAESTKAIVQKCPTYLNQGQLKHWAVFNELRYVLYAKYKGYKGAYKSLLTSSVWDQIFLQFQKRPFRYAPGITKLVNRDYFL